jgi:glycosyltransferase involved in cell wall biosynthesis
MPKYYSCADAMIVSLKKEKIFALTIPSKIQSYLASGKPIIASLEGEGARIIEESQSGFTCPPEDSLELVRIIKQFLLLSKIERHRLGVNGRSYFDKEFEREFLTNKLEDIFVS